jgi:hypothetical protein
METPIDDVRKKTHSGSPGTTSLVAPSNRPSWVGLMSSSGITPLTISSKADASPPGSKGWNTDRIFEYNAKGNAEWRH